MVTPDRRVQLDLRHLRLMIPVATGGGFAVPVVTSLLLDRVPALRAGTERRTEASRRLGGALSVAVFGPT
ncbi:hypothetical protein [Streptomyces viridochromogenes]|nr:hypothetical protein [Streptomyces viridochromogenes]